LEAASDNRDSIETKMILEEIKKLKLTKKIPNSLKYFDFKLLKRSLKELKEDDPLFEDDIDRISEYINRGNKEDLKFKRSSKFIQRTATIVKRKTFVKNTNTTVTVKEFDHAERQSKIESL
jgi:hypothetical protein